jgi:hypothetical protein
MEYSAISTINCFPKAETMLSSEDLPPAASLALAGTQGGLGGLRGHPLRREDTIPSSDGTLFCSQDNSGGLRSDSQKHRRM